MAKIDRFPIMLVCAGIGGNKYRNKRVFAWLRRLARNRTMMGGIGTGAYALARAGLLDGYRCTVHWEEFENFAREFPQLRLTADLFEVDRDRLTCPGGTASLDMMFHLIEQQHGRDLAWEIADEFIQHRVRSATTRSACRCSPAPGSTMCACSRSSPRWRIISRIPCP